MSLENFDDLLAESRRQPEPQRLLLVFNLSPDACAWPLPAAVDWLAVPGVVAATQADGTLHVPARGVACAVLEA